MYQINQRLLPEEDGLLSGTPSPENLLRLGAALASAAPQLLIGAEPDAPFSDAAAGILAGASAAAGASVTLVKQSTLPELSAASAAADIPLMVHIAEHRLRVFSKGMLPLTEPQQSCLLHQPSPQWLAPSLYGEIKNGNGLTSLYPSRIRKRLPDRLTVLPEIATGSAPLHRLMTRLLRGGKGQLLTMQLSSDGRRLALYHTDCGWIFHERLLLLVCQQLFARGEDAALPYWVPRAAEDMASRCGRRILRYASCSDGTDAEARALALHQGFTLDGTILCAEILRMLSEHGMSLKEWLSRLPDCHTVRRIVRLPTDAADGTGESPLQTWQTISHAIDTAEGYFTEESRGRALVRPSRSGRTVTLLTEAASMEAAAELAGDITALLERPSRF